MSVLTSTQRSGAVESRSDGPWGDASPCLITNTPGPRSLRELARFSQVAAPMGPKSEAHASPGPVVVYAEGQGCNVVDVDGNCFVDLVAGFGSLLLGHRCQAVVQSLSQQSQRLLQSLGDVHPSDVKIELLQELSKLHPSRHGVSILGQSGADAIAAALKTAVLHTGRSGVVAFRGAYHGLSYGPLSVCGLRSSYRTPFAEQLNDNVQFLDYPETAEQLTDVMAQLKQALASGLVGAVLFEPIAGRAGCLVPASGFASQLGELSRQYGALLIADEIWTGLGRAGHWLFSASCDCEADLICLGKGLGGGLPISACIGTAETMSSWSRDEEVVHTSTFAGAPLASATAVALLGQLREGQWVPRAQGVGRLWLRELQNALRSNAAVRHVRGAGLMVGIELSGECARTLQGMLLAEGYLVSLGGGVRESLVLTPPLNISEQRLAEFVEVVSRCSERLP